MRQSRYGHTGHIVRRQRNPVVALVPQGPTKQFVPLVQGKSLLQLTLERASLVSTKAHRRFRRPSLSRARVRTCRQGAKPYRAGTCGSQHRSRHGVCGVECPGRHPAAVSTRRPPHSRRSCIFGYGTLREVGCPGGQYCDVWRATQFSQYRVWLYPAGDPLEGRPGVHQVQRFIEKPDAHRSPRV